jgi:hypothetical protein
MINLFLKNLKNHFIVSVATLFIGFLTVLPFTSVGQEESGSNQNKDKSKKQIKTDTSFYNLHNPRKATIYSMILPGLGQTYNKKYWKIPIVYAGFGVCYYLISFNDKEYKAWREAYYHALDNTDNSEPPVNDYEEMYGDYPDIMKDQKDYYRRNRDLTYIFTGIWYLLNVVDAAVDAHLFSWEIDETLSLKFEPALTDPLYGYRPNGGIKLTLNFK